MMACNAVHFRRLCYGSRELQSLPPWYMSHNYTSNYLGCVDLMNSPISTTRPATSGMWRITTTLPETLTRMMSPWRSLWMSL